MQEARYDETRSAVEGPSSESVYTFLHGLGSRPFFQIQIHKYTNTQIHKCTNTEEGPSSESVYTFLRGLGSKNLGSRPFFESKHRALPFLRP